MSLSSLQLDAFVAVSKARSFSLAAQKLHITQSALSQRILNLESELGSTLFVRESSGIRLTDLGQRLLRYCQAKDSLEAEFLGSLQGEEAGSLSGVIKVAGFSSVVRSVLVPCISAIVAEHPNLQVEFYTKELRELPALLESGEADFILLNKPYEKHGIENVELGIEEYVLVQPAAKKFRDDVFLDHDPEDTTTADFFKLQTRAPKQWRRSYFDEIYAIIDGVLAGSGRAVLPLHLVKGLKGLAIAKGSKPLRSPVYLCYYQQAYYTQLQKRVIEQIQTLAPKLLGK
jgi:DNA-binding transcriptional LysR family regulator